nr:hypothetical protein [Bacteroidota bacterium]
MNKYHCIFVMAIMISCSSGYDWVKHNLNISEGLHDIEVIDDHIAIAYSYGTGNVYKTKNGGRNWNKIYQFDSIYFEQIQFLDERNG